MPQLGQQQSPIVLHVYRQHFIYGIKYTCINSPMFKYMNPTICTNFPR